MTQRTVRSSMALSAIGLGAMGAMLLFAPLETAGLLVADPGDPVLLQLLGATLLGWGAANWLARGAVLGGIYGRAVVAGNNTQFTIAALLLLKRAVTAGGSPLALWGVTVPFVAGALFFGYLMYFSPGLPAER